MYKDSFKGFSLFNDIEDKDLRNRNRAVVLANIAADNTRNKLISPKGASLILGYFGLVPPEERKDVQDQFTQRMLESGFVLS
jgi:hypothetical protein